ncbi:MAG: hypothetical protein H6Q73_881 [Firmicutes bacterium]|nr:hypothetical protein [Bacillota bacterium]
MPDSLPAQQSWTSLTKWLEERSVKKMSDLITISGVRGFIDEHGTAHLNLEDVARGLGFTEIAASGNETIRWRTVKGYLEGFGFIATSCDGGSQQVGKDVFIPENIFYRLAMKAKNEAAEAFQAKVADEILPEIRKTGTYGISPLPTLTQAQILAAVAQQAADQEQRILKLSSEVQGIRDVVALNPHDWRKDSSLLITKMAQKLGGNDHIRDLRKESYDLLNKRFGVSVETRLTNKRNRLASEGVCKSKRDKLNPLDVIGDDKKLIEGYVAIVKEMAIKYGAA